MHSIEYERKQLISYETYKKLSSTLDGMAACDLVIQTNYYYDDKDFSLYRKNETLRIRQKQNRLYLQRKYNKSVNEDGIRICEESNKEIDSFLPIVIIGDGRYEYVGNLTTLRKNYVMENCIISLDMNYYFGVVDYELEIESASGFSIPKAISENVQLNSNQLGKYSRFMNKLIEIREANYEL